MIFFLSGCDRQRKKNRDEGFAIRKKKRKFFDGAGFGRKRKKGTILDSNKKIYEPSLKKKRITRIKVD